MFFSRPAGHKLVDRGDPDAYDYSVGDFTKDGLFHELDLSAIVPSNAKFIGIRAVVRCTAAQDYCIFRKKGNVNTKNAIQGYVSINDGYNSVMGNVPCNSTRIIEYSFTANFTIINFCVCGWII